MGYVRLPRAEADLDEIWLFLVSATGNAELADRVLESLGARFQSLALSPYIGRARNEVGPRLRSFPAGDYIIWYEIHEGDIVIHRVVHAKRDVDSILGQ